MAETNKSGLISSAEVIEELNADTLISVAAGSGEPQKNAKLSSFASALQKEDSKIPTAETMEFVRALDAEGKPILISKNDLATVVAENMYPIGSIYMSCSETNPSVIFGFGTWELIKDTFLLGAGDVYDAGSTGGEATHQLSVEEMPSHAHRQVVCFSHEGSEWNIPVGGKSSWWDSAATDIQSAAAGGDQPHNNMPPYLAVYIWKRVA